MFLTALFKRPESTKHSYAELMFGDTVSPSLFPCLHRVINNASKYTASYSSTSAVGSCSQVSLSPTQFFTPLIGTAMAAAVH